MSFEDSLKLSKVSLLMSGISIFPEELSESTKRFLEFLFYFNFIWLYTDVIGEFLWIIEGVQLGKSFSELTSIAPCFTICLLASAKSTPLYFNRHLLVKIVNKLREIHPINENVDKIEEKVITCEFETPNFETEANLKETRIKSAAIESEIVKDAAKILNTVVLLLFYSSIVVVIVFSISALISMAYDYYTFGETELKLPFDVKYFFNPFEKAVYPWVYAHQVWSTLISAYNVFGADTFIYAFCIYLQMHFRILCHRYEHLVSGSSNESRARLVQLVRRHQDLIKLVDQMEIINAKSTLFNIVSSSILICLSGFNVAFVEDVSVAFAFFTFLLLSLAQISLLCLFGDMLMRSSTTVTEAIYKCRWYDADETTKKDILFIITRTQKPCKLTAANFANINLSAFTTILSRSWSYFALLRTMYK